MVSLRDLQGVPKFYRWLSERYPLINQNIEDSTLLPEFDRLYLDMNGILHNATHGNEGISRVLSEKEVMLKMISYIDMIVKIVKPKEVLYMAIDGVAPRAKMNQQRSRRFRAAKELAEAREKARKNGEEINEEDVFDSNCITPGTEFMAKVSKHLKYFIRKKLEEDPVWQRLRVVFSGHEVPGEGEHKIMDFIRAEKSQPCYDPNTRHCMAGLDADLIMLSLASHEPHFSLLREHIDFSAFSRNKFATKEKTRQLSEVKWELLHISLLREYLEIDMRSEEIPVESLTFPYDGERIVDDFVLLTVLCGNDFVPHLPSLDVGEGALDELLASYRRFLPYLGGYLVERGEINFDRLEQVLRDVAEKEPQVLQERKEKLRDIRQKDSKRRERMRERGYEVEECDDESSSSGSMLYAPGEFENDEEGADSTNDFDVSDDDEETEEAEGSLPNMTTGASPEEIMNARERLESGDLKGQYYLDKFGIGPGISGSGRLKQKLVQCFAEALQWVMYYYYRGVPSWGWFYPFHYSPMTSDLKGLSSLHIEFAEGKPFLPFQQLLGCLPSASAQFLPQTYRELMTAENSPLAEFYPGVHDVKIDMNGKLNPWEGVTLVPFIQEHKMLDAIAKYCPDDKLTETEKARNSFGSNYEFWFDPSGRETVASTLPEYFPTMENTRTRVKTYTLPPIPGDGIFNPLPPAGCVVPAAGFPSLHSLALKAYRAKAGIQVLNRKSRMESVMLAVGRGKEEAQEIGSFPLHRPVFSVQYANGTSVSQGYSCVEDSHLSFRYESASAAATDVLGTVVYVDWPHMHIGQVVGLSDVSESLYLKSEPGVSTGRMGNLNVDRRAHMVNDRKEWANQVQNQQKRLYIGGEFMSRAGIHIGEVKVLVKVRKLVGMRRDASTGELKRVFAKEGTSGEVLLPDQLVVLQHPSPDLRFREKGPRPVEDRYPIGETVVMLRRYRGAKGTIVGHEQALEGVRPMNPTGVTLKVQCKHKTERCEAFTSLAKHWQYQETYKSSQEIGKELNLSPNVVGLLAGSIRVMGGNPRGFKRHEDYADIGLNLKLNKDFYLPGYARLVTSQRRQNTGSAYSSVVQNGGAQTWYWEFSLKAKELLQRYKEFFPWVITVLERNEGPPRFRLKDFGGGSSIQEVLNWLEQLSIRNKKLVPVSSFVLSEKAVPGIEKAVGFQRKEEGKTVTVNDVAPEDVFAPEHWGYAVGNIGGSDAMGHSTERSLANHCLHGATPRLGDRVVNLVTRHVALGLRGTVVAVHPSTHYVEVMWDEEFIGGSNLEGLCPSGRGSLSSWASVLNLSQPPIEFATEPASSSNVQVGAFTTTASAERNAVGINNAAPAAQDGAFTTTSSTERSTLDRAQRQRLIEVLEDAFVQATDGSKMNVSGPASSIRILLSTAKQGFIEIESIMKCLPDEFDGTREQDLVDTVKNNNSCLQLHRDNRSIRRAWKKNSGYVAPKQAPHTNKGTARNHGGKEAPGQNLAAPVKDLFQQFKSANCDNAASHKSNPRHSSAPNGGSVPPLNRPWRPSDMASLQPASSEHQESGRSGFITAPRDEELSIYWQNLNGDQGDGRSHAADTKTSAMPARQDRMPPQPRPATGDRRQQRPRNRTSANTRTGGMVPPQILTKKH